MEFYYCFPLGFSWLNCVPLGGREWLDIWATASTKYSWRRYNLSLDAWYGVWLWSACLSASMGRKQVIPLKCTKRCLYYLNFQKIRIHTFTHWENENCRTRLSSQVTLSVILNLHQGSLRSHIGSNANETPLETLLAPLAMWPWFLADLSNLDLILSAIAQTLLFYQVQFLCSWRSNVVWEHKSVSFGPVDSVRKRIPS